MSKDTDELVLEALLVLQQFQRGEPVTGRWEVGHLLNCCFAASIRGWLKELRVTLNDEEAKQWAEASGRSSTGFNLRIRIKLSRLGKKELEVYARRVAELG